MRKRYLKQKETSCHKRKARTGSAEKQKSQAMPGFFMQL